MVLRLVLRLRETLPSLASLHLCSQMVASVMLILLEVRGNLIWQVGWRKGRQYTILYVCERKITIYSTLKKSFKE